MNQKIFKINMKAKARLLLILICMVSFTGFGTTTDLRQNSDFVTIENCSAVENVVANVVDNENRFTKLFQEADKVFNVVFKEKIYSYKPILVLSGLQSNLRFKQRLQKRIIKNRIAFLKINYWQILELYEFGISEKKHLNKRARDGTNFRR